MPIVLKTLADSELVEVAGEDAVQPLSLESIFQYRPGRLRGIAISPMKAIFLQANLSKVVAACIARNNGIMTSSLRTVIVLLATDLH